MTMAPLEMLPLQLFLWEDRIARINNISFLAHSAFPAPVRTLDRRGIDEGGGRFGRHPCN
jgi:hypothetical protein